ncbi:hypothetical protein HJC23_002198 [Cyclotella cryptica]|uniref:carnosine N-methyltransferase n=1 Tax=Cyclotella cryptica TaxID=29204 RepID=A0ABD3Q6B0_9STRA|eukprot:CCRYP_008234-RA/>CCRYP_008234-RA protein AED:0.07 eAED:0.07 QI:0/-1/0/1/-1/1/1/0/473
MAAGLLLTLFILPITLRPVVSFCPLRASVSIPKQDDALHNDVDQLIREKLGRIASEYENHVEKLKRTLEMEIELSEKTETCLLRGTTNDRAHFLLSEKLRRKRDAMTECLAANDLVVKRLLSGSLDAGKNSQTKTSKLFESIEYISSSDDDYSLLMGNGGVTDQQKKETEGYDTALQVITHTARDWTSGSSPCRDATNGWIIRAILDNCTGMDRIRILVPGSGLCRLAYDIATSSDIAKAGTKACVEANDSSVTMAFAAKSVLDMVQKQAVSKIYPFVSDPLRNEIDSAKRFNVDVFPDEEALASYRYYNMIRGGSPDLTYTVGDFSLTYKSQSKRGLYDVVATAFFVDTATNIYEYIFIMKHLLKDKSSIWVNCGPVQWHPCAMLRPTVDELRDILKASGFELITWEIAPETLAYRHPDDYGALQARYTREEGYRSLRFVARLSTVDAADDLHLRIEYIEYLNEVANGKIKL